MQIHVDRTDRPAGIQGYGWHYGYMWLIVSQNNPRYANIVGVCIPQGHKWYGWNSVAIMQYRETPLWWEQHSLRPVGASWRGTSFGYFGDSAFEQVPTDGMYWLFAVRSLAPYQKAPLGGAFCNKYDTLAMCELLDEVS